METFAGGRFTGRVAVVTGAGSGLGHATAIRLATEGALVGCLDIAAEAAEKTAAEIAERAATPAPTRPTSPTRRRCAPRSTARLRTSAGRSSSSTARASVGSRTRTRLPFEDWQRIIGVNLTGTFLVCQAGAPVPARRRRRDREHRVERGHQGAALQRCVLRVEGRRRAPHQVSRRRVHQARHPRELRRAGRHRDAVAAASSRTCPKVSTGRRSAR